MEDSDCLYLWRTVILKKGFYRKREKKRPMLAKGEQKTLKATPPTLSLPSGTIPPEGRRVSEGEGTAPGQSPEGRDMR